MIFMLVPINFSFGQLMTDVKFNHLSFTFEKEDLRAFRESSFIKDTLCVLETRTTNIDSFSTSTTYFLYGQSNYLELFETTQDDPNLGFLTIVLSVDKINGLQELKKELDKTYQTGIRTRERNFDDQKIPWYESLAVLDMSIIGSAYMTQARFWFWIMGYKKEYFEYNGYKIENDELTRENYLEKHSTIRRNRLIKNFSGIVVKLNQDEKEYIKKFFDFIGYKKLSENEYMSLDGFRFQLNDRQKGDQCSLESIEFVTSKELIRKKEIRISDHISVSIQGNKGYFLIN